MKRDAKVQVAGVHSLTVGVLTLLACQAAWLLYSLSGLVAVTHPLIISHEPFETFQHLIHD